MKNFENTTLDGNTGHFHEEIDLSDHRAWSSSHKGSCYASETWYPQWYCSEDRRVSTDAVPGQIALNDWCLVVTVQTTVEVPQLYGVLVKIPQVQSSFRPVLEQI